VSTKCVYAYFGTFASCDYPGYHRLGDAEKKAIVAILDSLDMLTINEVTLEIAVALRQQRKMSSGDALIAGTCLDYGLPLATANTKDFEWIDELVIHNPLELII